MKVKVSRFVVCALLLVWAAIPLVCQQPGLPGAQIEQIEKAITQAMARGNIPGLSVAVAVEGQLRFSNGYGLADVENSVPAKATTVYRLASISKPVTAVAAMQLAEKGKLDLDAPVRRFVPSFPEKPWPITPRQLLGHLGGIRHYNNRAEVNSTLHYDNVLDPLGIFQNDPLVAEPGTKYSYTTYGYVLLGAIVKRASGSPFVEYIRENIFKPAGMDRIQADDVYAIIPNRARGYRISPEGKLENCALADTSNKIPGGGLNSSAADLVKFALAVRDGVLLKPESVEQMFTPQKLRSGEQTRYGLGWSVGRTKGRRIVGHGGGQQGVSTMLRMLPRQGVVVALMSNLEQANLPALSNQILNILLK